MEKPAMEKPAMEKPPLSDLSIFRFPELTGDVIFNIVLLVGVLGLTVLLTILAQKAFQRGSRTRTRRSSFERFSSEHHMEPPVRETLARLMAYGQAADEYAFVNDAIAYEAAVERLLEEGSGEEAASLAKLRRSLHLNVMNPERELVSTRQLLQEQSVRLLAGIGTEKLDLYCALLEVNEEYLLIDLPYQAEIYHLLTGHPDVQLLFWREREGETVFRIALEAIEEGQFPAFRARHAFRDGEAVQRAGFRLSVDLPAAFQFMNPREMKRPRDAKLATVGPKMAPGVVGERPKLRKGEARLLDLGYGGVSLVSLHPLEERGLAQLSFELNGQPMRLMAEVISCGGQEDGQYLVRARFRGVGEEAYARLQNTLYREQVKRLREKNLLHLKLSP